MSRPKMNVLRQVGATLGVATALASCSAETATSPEANRPAAIPESPAQPNAAVKAYLSSPERETHLTGNIQAFARVVVEAASGKRTWELTDARCDDPSGKIPETDIPSPSSATEFFPGQICELRRTRKTNVDPMASATIVINDRGQLDTERVNGVAAAAAGNCETAISRAPDDTWRVVHDEAGIVGFNSSETSQATNLEQAQRIDALAIECLGRAVQYLGK